VARAKENRLPVVIGNGSDRRLLRRVSLARARALAVVTSDEVENIGIAVTARAMRDDLRVALRAGDGDATSETSSLFGIGTVRDVFRIAGTAIAAAALGHQTRQAFPHEGVLYLVDRHGDLEPFIPVDGTVGPPPSRREHAPGATG
jgi:voltage-gated potassium channel Kch